MSSKSFDVFNQLVEEKTNLLFTTVLDKALQDSASKLVSGNSRRFRTHSTPNACPM